MGIVGLLWIYGYSGSVMDTVDIVASGSVISILGLYSI